MSYPIHPEHWTALPHQASDDAIAKLTYAQHTARAAPRPWWSIFRRAWDGFWNCVDVAIERPDDVAVGQHVTVLVSKRAPGWIGAVFCVVHVEHPFVLARFMVDTHGWHSERSGLSVIDVRETRLRKLSPEYVAAMTTAEKGE